MQAIKDKLYDMNATRQAKAEAKAEEKAEKHLAKARMEIAHEVSLAKQAEAEMEAHVNKAGEVAQRETAKYGADDRSAKMAAEGQTAMMPTGSCAALANDANARGAPPSRNMQR